MTPRRWIWTGCVAGLIVLLFVLWLVQVSTTGKHEAHVRWKEKIQQIRVLTKGGKVIPSVELLKNLEHQRVSSQAKLDSLLNTLNKSSHALAYENALAFKGDLFKVQRALLARGGALSIGVPADIGFKDFTGKEIPPVSELEALSFQLVKIRDFVELLMECPVGEIQDIQRGSIERQRIEPDEDPPFYQSFAFKVHFFCSAPAFRKFLSSLLGTGSVFILENLDVSLKSENVLEVEASVKAVSFLNTRSD